MRNFFRAAALAAAFVTAALAATAYIPTVTVSVTTSATSLAGKTDHVFVRACNADTSKTLYWSFSSTVTTANGDPLPPGGCIQFQDLARGQLLFGVTTSGTLDARVTEGFRQ